MLLRHLHQADAHPIRVPNPHLQQPPRLPLRLPQDRHATLVELPSHRGQLTHLQPQRHARCRWPGSATRQLQEPATQEEDGAPLRAAAELTVDGQPQRVPVEDPAALGVGWMQQQTAASPGNSATTRICPTIWQSKSVNSSADTHNSQGEIEQSASTFRSQSKVSPHDARNSGPVDRAAPPRTTKGGCYAGRSGRRLRRGRDRGVPSVGDVD